MALTPIRHQILSDRISFRIADHNDVSAATSILRLAAERMLTEGKKQWTESYPGEIHVRADIENRTAHVLELDGEVVGYGALVLDGEPAYDNIDGEWLSDEKYVVVHRLAILQSAECQGLGSKFLRAVENYARSLGIHSFRVDTNFDNERMLKLLEKNGFTYCGEVHYERGSRKAFEKLL